MRRTDPHVPLSDWVLTVGYSAASPVSLPRTALLKVRCERGGAVLRGDQQLPRGAVRRPAHRAQRVTLHSSAFVQLATMVQRMQQNNIRRAIVQSSLT